VTISGTIVMSVFGFVFIAFSALIGIIWKQQGERISAIEVSMRDCKMDCNDVLKDIYNELKHIRLDQGAAMLKISESYVNKHDCERTMASANVS